MASFKIQTFPGSNESGSGQDSTEDIDGVNSLVDGSTPTSADADAAITNLEGNISTQAASISSGLNTLFGQSPAGNRLDQIDDFVANATIPSTDPETFTSWVVGTRPDDSVLSEGDFAVDTTHGRGYRWDNTVGALLPIDVYGNTFDLVARVNGDEADATELTNYEEDKSAGANGDITYNGTSVTLEGTNPNGQVLIRIPQALEDANIDNTKNYYYRFVAQQDNLVGTNHVMAFMIYDGTHQFHFRRVSSNPFRRTTTSATNQINTSITDDAPFGPTDTNTHVVEMYVKRDSDEDVAYAIVDGKVYHLSAMDQGGNSSTTTKAIQVFCRGNASGNSLDLKIYESTFCAW